MCNWLLTYPSLSLFFHTRSSSNHPRFPDFCPLNIPQELHNTEMLFLAPHSKPHTPGQCHQSVGQPGEPPHWLVVLAVPWGAGARAHASDRVIEVCVHPPIMLLCSFMVVRRRLSQSSDSFNSHRGAKSLYYLASLSCYYSSGLLCLCGDQLFIT